MAVVSMGGGLGNQMFIYAFGRALSENLRQNSQSQILNQNNFTQNLQNQNLFTQISAQNSQISSQKSQIYAPSGGGDLL